MRLDRLYKSLLVPTMGVLLLAAFAVSALTTKVIADRMAEQQNASARAMGELLAGMASPYVTNFDLTALGNLVRQLERSPGLVFAEIVDADGESFTADVLPPPASLEGLLIIEQAIVDSVGVTTGKVRLAYRDDDAVALRNATTAAIVGSMAALVLIAALVLTYSDITARKAAENSLRKAYDELEDRVLQRTGELRESQQRFRDFAEAASDWLWEMDEDLRFSYLSERFFAVAAASPEDVIGKRRWEVAIPDERFNNAEAWEAHRQTMLAHRPIRNFEYSFKGRDESVRRIRITGKPVFDEQGNFKGYRGTGSDVTELVQAQSELLHSEKLAALGALVAGVAHEINTPVGIGLTAASYLEEKIQRFGHTYESGKVKRSDIEGLLASAHEASNSLLTNLRRAADLVRSFKQIAVDQSSDMRRTFKVREYLDEVMLSLRPRLKRTRHSITIDCPESIEIDSYPGALSQIITNFVINSLIHGFEGVEEGHISISVTESGGELVLIYRDDGIGMSPEILRHVFEPFFTTKRGRGGSGLGLHLVFNLVSQTLRGKLDVSSSEGKGVRFVIRFPVKGEAQDDSQQ